MDVTTSLKSLLLAVRQYRDSRTAQNAAQLQKQVEVRWMFCLLGMPFVMSHRPRILLRGLCPRPQPGVDAALLLLGLFSVLPNTQKVPLSITLSKRL